MDFDIVTTKAGDNGYSSLYNGKRLEKSNIVFEVLGTIDELNSYLGIVKTAVDRKNINKNIESIQKNLMKISAEIAVRMDDPGFNALKKISDKDLIDLEELEKELLSETKIKNEFIIPGANNISANIDYSRTITRRAERWMVKYIREQDAVNLYLAQKYLNRLSDYLFVLARYFEK